MKLKKLLIGLVAFLMFASPSFAQSFGVRLGYPFGVQYSTGDVGKQGTGFRIAVGTFFFSGIEVQADLMLGQIKLGDGAPLTLFYGAGLHAGYSFFFGYFGFGPQGTIGLEYVLQKGLSLFFDTSIGVDINLGFSLPVTVYVAGTFGISFKI